ncbi:hypothetical protein PATSB16_05450 [Pandoraea thiooxydans]|uniref:Lipoprotein n=1 Tax=Pandoraea thiooxydans TaxID=445709 RepID=A0A0G3EIZ6_9BURK|nr:hypothetical protein [Pandoraea thiooxydans]AKJ66983.1 hypothetical protein ABW99_00785 [Pandoraea thiooxydans]APR93887.1 hypothetical protein PATSB16_05450 [Pandoraea thiooxydans]
MIKLLTALALTALLAGCVVAPPYGYYAPGPAYGYGYNYYDNYYYGPPTVTFGVGFGGGWHHRGDWHH